MSLLQRLDSFLNKFESALLVFFLTVMILLAFLQVVLRNAFSEGILWADILLRHLVLWIGFLGAAIATSHDRHINIDALTRFLTGRVRSSAKVLTYLFAAAICILLFDASLAYIRLEVDLDSTVYEEIPSWYAAAIIPGGYALLAIHFLIRVALAMNALVRGEKR
ncbi:MAG TPA: TRAP transporter small permease [Bacteroidota bacterium]|nr:TRAP transporter small permease [Bacteroidota bacterium]